MEKNFKVALALFIVSQIVDLVVTIAFVQAFGPAAELVPSSREKIIYGGLATIAKDKFLGALIIVAGCLVFLYALRLLRPKITRPRAQRLLVFAYRMTVAFLLLESWLVGFGPVLRGLISLLE